ncbi:efflux RND transporter periplasmic adaptor subunit [Vibrio sp. 99-8-1]|uniref:efflux RND transporter periplasmic adaptor subunit n=1 Tax=Vibrio sp. 99-8-1 TaxID=2607602 RepID=UPI0014937D7E|nr:efflux RND transporter periplasmic adaptor subunit [Vibrio sp. 99-8-1]NOI67353.1 efflux RND transporter periplasmic adaptor subunit [Vibrio sp. 99-8-1]
MKRNVLTIAITALSAASIFGAVAYNGNQMMEPGEDKQQTKTEQIDSNKEPSKASSLLATVSLPQVDVVEAQVNAYQAEVIGYGEAKAKFELSFAAEVSGRVDSINRNFESGQVVKKGEILATIDSTQYEQALAEAKSNYAQAKLNLLEEERKGVQAKSEWQKSGVKGEPASPLVLREPQLENAKMALETAQKAQKKAQEDLNNTKIRAPFDALVVSRNISPGSYIQTAGELATLYSIDEMEIEIPLSENQWKNIDLLDNSLLKQNQEKRLVALTGSDGLSHWQGYVSRVEQHLDANTRQRSLIVTVDHPLEQSDDLYPGTFVQATIKGADISGLWKLPASAISQQGDIWVVEDEQLQRYVAEKRFESGGFVYISALDTVSDSSLVVKRPLSSYKSNMPVAAKMPSPNIETALVDTAMLDMAKTSTAIAGD